MNDTKIGPIMTIRGSMVKHRIASCGTITAPCATCELSNLFWVYIVIFDVHEASLVRRRVAPPVREPRRL